MSPVVVDDTRARLLGGHGLHPAGRLPTLAAALVPLRRFLPTAVVVVTTLALIVTAAFVPGTPVTDLQLNDGAVYVTKQSAQLVGKFNPQIAALAASVQTVNSDFDIAQNANRLLLIDRSAHQLQRIDPVTQTTGTPTKLPVNARVSLGGDTVTVTDPATGATWARSFDEAFGVDYAHAKPDLVLGRSGVSVAGPDGLLRAVSIDKDTLYVQHPDGSRSTTTIPFQVGADVQLSVVAGTAVLLDPAAGVVWVPGHDPVDLPDGAGARLQAPAAAAAVVDGNPVDAMVATRVGLVAIDGGDARVVAPAAGDPAQPVVVAGCAYAAWAGDGRGTVIRACADRPPVTTPIRSLPKDPDLVFRVNRDHVVLNDAVGGNIWLVTQDSRLISGWEKVTPPEPDQGDQTQNSKTTAKINPNRSLANRPPVAVDDSVAARAGRSTELPLLDNDSDPDGDILTFDEPSRPGQGTLARVRGGAGMQITLPPDASGQTTFHYTISDGRGGTATASVRLQILPSDPAQDRPPRLFRTEPIVTTLGQTVTRHVLQNWRDPDGDPMVLVGATVKGDDEVRFTPDGTLTYIDAGTKSGRKLIAVTVSDGIKQTTEQVPITVRGTGTVPPQANGDFVTARAGEPVVVHPLDNDTGNEIYLTRVDSEVPGAQVDPDYDHNAFTFTAAKPGSYYVGYIVSNGPTAFGLVRIDVSGPSTDNRPPVAAPDTALLPAGGSVLIDPLANDEDPDDDVVVIQSVDQTDGLRLDLIHRHLVQISAVTTPEEPVRVTYTISDGHASATGTITVIPIVSTASPDPRAKADEATVRAGDTVTVPVLANDSSPLGLDLHVDKIAEQPSAGAAWIDNDMIRFTAPHRAGDYTAVYQVVDTEGNVASAQVKFYVTSTDSPNNPPAPEEVTARVLAGSDTRILIPLRGIDPDGDTVRLVGLDTGPQLGRISAVGNGYLSYQAYPTSAGTDTFRYAVVDALGARATGEIRVGVVPRAAGNNPPTVVDDAVTARPGRTVRVPVLDNDSDPDADPFGFAAHPLNFPAATGAHLVDNTIQLRVPTTPGTIVGQYTVVDRRGAEASGDVRITADPKAPLLAPVLTDDQVTAAEVAGKDVVDVPVLANDYDPDGNIADAALSLPAAGSSANATPGADAPVVVGDKVRVHLTDALQVIRYQVTDPDGNKAWALLLVPGRADAVPALRGAIKPQQVKAGESLRLAINHFVIGTQGRPVQLTTEDRIFANNGTGSAVDADTVEFDAPPDYVGPAAIEFEVTDGTSADDPNGHTAVLTIPITVLPNDKPAQHKDDADSHHDKPENSPPTFVDLSLTVGAGEPARSVSLRGGADDPDDDPLTFTKPTGHVPAGITVGFAGDRLTVKAASSVEPGTSFTLTGRVSDGKASVPTHVSVEVTATTRPLAVTADDVVPDAVQGRRRVVHVLANDINPFPGTPLTVVSTVVEAGKVSDQGVVDHGRAVSVTPAPHFVGTVVLRYTVRDATGDTAREVEGRIRLTVKGAPGRPGTPRRVDVGDRHAVITWTAPADNGAAIAGYTVTGTGSDASHVRQACATTTCTLTGLTNDVTYRFTVTATNAVGTSAPSASSAGIRPDVRPGRPGRPQPRFGDQRISLTWTAAPTKGSAVTQYVVELSGPQGIQRRTIGPQTHYVWDGLQNGSAYTFRVQAKNKAPTPSDFSARSTVSVPAGKPSAPRSVRGTDSGGNLGRQVRVQWQAPAKNNGDKIRSYRVYANKALAKTVDGDTRAVTLRLTNGTTYRFTVVAVNKAGASPRSRTSAAVTPYGAPSRPGRPTLKPHNHSVTIGFPNAKPNGHPISRYQARLNGGSPFRVTHGQRRSGLTNGTSYYVQVRACSNTKCSAWNTRSAAVVPYGPPATPNPSAAHVGGVRYRFHWSYPARSNGAKITKLQIRTLVGKTWSSWHTEDLSGSVTLGTRGNQKLEVRVRVTNSHGDRATGSVSRTTPAPRVRSFAGAWDRSASANKSQCPSGECFQVHAEVSNFPRNTKVTCTDHKYRIRKASKRTDGTGHISDVGRMGSLGQNLDDYRVTCSGGGVSVTSPNPPSWPTHH